MASDTIKKHPYHMVPPSPWPAVGTLAALLLAFGGIWYMKGGPIYLLLTGLVLVLWVFYRWWRDVVAESRPGADHTDTVRMGLRMGMVFFIASEVMFFFAFFWAFFHSSSPILSLVAPETWPPEGVKPLDAWSIPFLNTDAKVINFLNERPVTWAIVKEGNVKDLNRILKGLDYTIEEHDGIGGKYILKIIKNG